MNPDKSSTQTNVEAPSAEPTPDEIALCAYAIWEGEGRPEGRETEHWQQAEAQLRRTRAQG
jgi:hypothetical protein